MAYLDATKMLFMILLIMTILNLVFGRIDFTVEPKDAVVAENSKLLIPCTATTTLSGTLLILWKKQNNWIVDFNSKHYSQLANGSLLFQRFLTADQGVYQCSAIVQSSGHHRLGQIYSRNATIKLAYILNNFTLNPDSRSGQIGSNLQLQCLSPKSEPIADVYWEKDNIRLHGYENGSLILKPENILSSTLLIRNLSIQHIGSYKCIAYNALIPGKTIKSNTATVSIAARQEQPYFETRPVSVVASRYQPFTWNCVIRGIPQPTIRWYQNGVLVTDDANRLKLSSGSLRFVLVQEAHNGTYVCEGSNSIGKVSNSPVPFIVAFIDYEFVQNPLSATINAGQTLILRSSPPRRYPISVKISWYWNYSLLKKSANVIIMTDGSLQIVAVTKSHEGVYFCEAENPVTSERRTSKTATVSVRVGPVINTALNNISAIVGQSLTITCNASGSPIPSIQWLKSNRVIVSNGQLSLSRIRMADAGFYTCKAMNPAGNQSKTFYLKVSTTPSINVAPLNATKIAGGSVEMRCDFYGDPKPTTTWYFMANGASSPQLIRTTSRISITGITLRIIRLLKADEGRYICRGQNTGGQKEVSASLIVLVPPSFISLPTNQTTVKGSSVSFQCIATGFPIPLVSWYFKGHQISTNSKYIVGSTSITVNNAGADDAGWYMCRISNSAGLKNSTAYLDVQVAPVIRDFSVPHTVKIRSSFSLKCMGSGNPKPVVRWQQNKTNIVIDGLRITGNMENLTVNNARSQDSGLYVCSLSNFLGSSNRNQTLLVQVFPHPPKSLQAKSFQSTSITVSWAQGFDGYSPTLGFILQFSRKDVEEWRTYANNIASSISNYTVIGLKPFTTYKFRMKAFTNIGESVYGIPVEARTLEDAPSVPLGLTVRITNGTTAIVEWTRPSEDHGVISLYQLHYGIIDTSNITTINLIARNQPNHQITIHNLRPFSTYYFRMRAATGPKSNPNWGNVSDVVYCHTPETVPSSAPVIQNSSAVSSTSIRIVFIGLTSNSLNGILTGYRILMKSPISQKTIITNSTIITVGNLQKFLRYEIYIVACNRVGCGPKSKSVFVTTHEDIPGAVSNISVIHMNSTSVLIKWSEPLQKNGLITGYIITIRSKHGKKNYTQLVGNNVHQLLKGGLMQNSTLFITIAARTSKGIGPHSKKISIKLSVHDTTTTSSKGLTSSKAPITLSQSSTSSTLTPKRTTPFGKTKAQTSVDWLDEKNLPILIGVSVTIFILLIIVIVFISMTCARRFVAGDVKRDRWISTRTHSSADNPAYEPNKDVELKHKAPMMSPRASDLQPNKVEIPKKVENTEDFLFENDSEQPVEEINQSNGYAFDDTVRMKGKDDKSTLMKLRDTEIDLGDDASEYDRPYSKLDELGESFSNDLFAFIEDEEKKNEFSSQESLPTKDESDSKSATSIDFEPILTAQLLEGSMLKSRDPKPKDIRDGESPVPKSELTWDPYDTSKAAEKNLDENEYDIPEIYHGDTDAIIPDSQDAESIVPHHSRENEADIPEYSAVDRSYIERKAANLAGNIDNNDKSGLINNESAPSYGVF